MSWWRRLVAGDATARERELEAELAQTKAALAVKQLECEQLAELNENLRLWLRANSMAAISIGGPMVRHSGGGG